MRARLRIAATVAALATGSACETVYGPSSPSVEWTMFESSRFTPLESTHP